MLRSLKEKSGKGGYWKGSLGEEVSITYNLLIVTKYEIRKYFGDHLDKNMVKKKKIKVKVEGSVKKSSQSNNWKVEMQFNTVWKS